MPLPDTGVAVSALPAASSTGALDLLGVQAGVTKKVPNGTYVRFAPLPTGVAATDVANVQGALNDIPATGGRALLHSTTAGGLKYNFGTTGVTVAPQKQLFGSAMRGTVIEYGGTGYAISVGNQVLGTALAYGCAVGELAINLTANASSGITLRETAAAQVRNVYIEGLPNTTTGTGVFVDGGNTASIFAVLDNVTVNHVKFSHRWGSTGTSTTTSVTATNCTGYGDSIAGSIGLTVDANSGNGSRWFGGNLEACATGVSNSGFGVSMYGPRFEANTVDYLLNSGAKANLLDGATGLATYTDNSGNNTNRREHCFDTSRNPWADLPIVAGALGLFKLTATAEFIGDYSNCDAGGAPGPNSTEYAVPFFLARPTRITSMVIKVTSAVASSFYRLGIRQDAGGVPGAIVVDAGQVDSSTTGIKTASIDVTLMPGVYWKSATPQGGASAAPVVNSSGVSPFLFPSAGHTFTAGDVLYLAWTQSGVTGALPATYTIGGSWTSAPRILLGVKTP